MLRDAAKRRIATIAALVGLGFGVVCIAAEFLNGQPGEPSIFGVVLPAAAWAEQAVIFAFGVVHLAVAVILTAFRRTAV